MPKEIPSLQLNKPFIGPDIKVAADTIPNTPLRGGGFKGIVPVVITPESLPKGRISSRDIQRTRVTMRSRYAQTGGTEIFNRRGIFPNKETSQFNPNEPVIINMELKTHASRPLFLPQGTGLFRFYDLNTNNQIKGSELNDLIDNQSIKIGTETEDDQWEPALKNDFTNGIFVKVRTDNRMWIPPHPENEPIVIPDNGNNYRQIIDQLLEPVPLDGKLRLWIGETPHLTLPKGVHAVLAPNTFRFKQNGNVEKNYHIKSRLIDDGSNWPIRVEIISPCDGHEEWVLFYFFRDPSKLPE